MMLIDWRSDLARDGHRVFISGLPIAMHCHHYNINLHKTLEDTLGEEGVQLLFNRSVLFCPWKEGQKSSHHLL